ncbi:MAG: hypothetical protein IJK89_11120 [Clostridia bacterium]|nr:hypothetical protein [Clostridia bacterium]
MAQTTKRTGLTKALAAGLSAVFLLLCGCARAPVPGEAAAPTSSGAVQTDVPAADKTDGTELLPGVIVSGPYPFSGRFVEDGSDEEVEDIAAVRLTNTGGEDYQYLEFTVVTQTASYAFAASSVHAGTAMTVLNKEKLPCREGETAVAAECPVHAGYQTPPSMLGDMFELKQATGSFSIRNVTGEDLAGTITVYYKCTDENGWFGGITFRTVLNGLAAGQEQWMPAEHMGRVVFVTYEE